MPQGRFHQDQSGSKIAMLTLLEQTQEKSKNGSYKYRVRCDCGTEKIVCFGQMTTGRAQSCGCLQRRKGEGSPAYKHGRSRSREYDLEYQMKKNYGIGFFEYDAMFEKQNGLCAICSSPPPDHHKKRLNIDHCHTSGRVRGLLCDACNRGIGLLKDSPDLMLKAISYLAR
jgi:hypothetical protein